MCDSGVSPVERKKKKMYTEPISAAELARQTAEYKAMTAADVLDAMRYIGPIEGWRGLPDELSPTQRATMVSILHQSLQAGKFWPELAEAHRHSRWRLCTRSPMCPPGFAHTRNARMARMHDAGVDLVVLADAYEISIDYARRCVSSGRKAMA